MSRINMRPPAPKSGAGKAASGADPAKQPKVSNAPAKASAKGIKPPAAGRVKTSNTVGHGMSFKNSKGC